MNGMHYGICFGGPLVGVKKVNTNVDTPHIMECEGGYYVWNSVNEIEEHIDQERYVITGGHWDFVSHFSETEKE